MMRAGTTKGTPMDTKPKPPSEAATLRAENERLRAALAAGTPPRSAAPVAPAFETEGDRQGRELTEHAERQRVADQARALDAAV
ncbi:MAG: hypothetical protein ACRCZP_16805 [Phycicoccus sp.]